MSAVTLTLIGVIAVAALAWAYAGARYLYTRGYRDGITDAQRIQRELVDDLAAVSRHAPPPPDPRLRR